MGVLRSTQSMEAEVEEMRAALELAPLGRHGAWRSGAAAKREAGAEEGAAPEARTVCVTGGISFVGLAVVDRLLRHGYAGRLALETHGLSSLVWPAPPRPWQQQQLRVRRMGNYCR